METDDKQAKLAEFKAKFKDSIIDSKKVGTDRFDYTKNKKSQAHGSTSNVITIHDTGTDALFTISVNCSSLVPMGDKMAKSDDRLEVLQAAVVKFLEGIHEEL